MPKTHKQILLLFIFCLNKEVIFFSEVIFLGPIRTKRAIWSYVAVSPFHTHYFTKLFFIVTPLNLSFSSNTDKKKPVNVNWQKNLTLFVMLVILLYPSYKDELDESFCFRKKETYTQQQQFKIFTVLKLF